MQIKDVHRGGGGRYAFVVHRESERLMHWPLHTHRESREGKRVDAREVLPGNYVSI